MDLVTTTSAFAMNMMDITMFAHVTGVSIISIKSNGTIPVKRIPHEGKKIKALNLDYHIQFWRSIDKYSFASCSKLFVLLDS